MRKIKGYDEFLEDFMADPKNAEWARRARIKFLRQRLLELIIAYMPLAETNTEEWLEELILEQMTKIKKEIDEVVAEIRLWNKPRFTDRKITEEMIESAKEYPIGNLVDVNRQGFAKCVWHSDSNPSMYCKNNYAYCFSCGGKGSVIDIYMALYGCDFKEAVKFLSKI